MTTGIETDPQAAAERVIGAEADAAPRKRGRPKGSGRKKSSTRTPRAESAPDEAPEIFVADVSAADVEIAGTLGGTIWGFVAPFAKLAPLDEKQEKKLGEALAPLFQKYAPALGAWQYEVNAVLVLAAIVVESKKSYVPPAKPETATTLDVSETGTASTDAAPSWGGR